LEPLQQEVEKMIEKMQVEKGKIEKIHAEHKEVLVEHITMESVEKLAKKSTQVREKFTQLLKLFHELQLAIQSVSYD
jgi:hypothetical protein